MSESGNIAQNVYQRWCADGLSVEIFDDGSGLILSQLQFVRLVASRQLSLNAKIKPGDSVLVASGRSVQYFIDLFVVWSLGAVVVPFPNDDDGSYKGMLLDMTSANCVLDDDFLKMEDFGNSSAVSLKFYECGAESSAAILFTSGSTGLPKGVMLSHGVLMNNSLAILDVLGMKRERLFVNIRFNFTSAICHFLACCFSNSALIGIEDTLLASDFPERICNLKPSGIGGAPIQLHWISDYFGANTQLQRERFQQSVNFFVSSGDHLPATLLQSVNSLLPSLDVFIIYGLTELGGRFCILDPENQCDRVSSVGKPIHGLRVSIFDPDADSELPVGEEGEIVASGSLISNGYYQNREATEKTFRSYGMRTGDLGYLDSDGFLYLSGRKDDVFKVNGKKVSSVLIVDAMMNAGLFSDAAVISADLPVFGTVPVAFYVSGVERNLSRGDIARELRKSLPNNHIPHQFIVVEEIPRTSSGKVKRKQLRELYSAIGSS